MRPERYTIEWTSPAKRALGRPPEKAATAAIEFIYGPLAENPRQVGRALRFELAGLHSAHRGDFRIVYRISEVTQTVYVEVIAHRAGVYRRCRRAACGGGLPAVWLSARGHQLGARG